MSKPNSSEEIPHLLGEPWAISESGLYQVQEAADQVGTIQAIMARNGDRPRDSELTQIRDGVAVIEVIGPIFHYENILTWIFGFPSAEGVMQEIQAALDNPQVQSIILQIDTPGGQVGGISELSGFVQEQSDKPINAFVGDLAASAGYWIASAAKEIVAADTAELGSIGIVFSMRRRSNNTLEIVNTASPKKRPDPETDEGRRQIQERADAIAEVFIEVIMENRDLSRDQVVSLQGDVVIASQAKNIGLADRIGTLEGLIAEMQGGKSKKIGVNTMTLNLEQMKADYAELYEQVKEEGRAEVRAEIDTAKTQANQEGQDHVMSLVEAVLGKEAKGKLDQVIQAGLSAEQVKTAKNIFGQAPVSGQQNSAQQQILEGLEAATPPPAPVASEDGQTEPQQFETKVNDYQQKHNCKRSRAIGAIAASHPKLHEAWIRDQQKK